MTRRWNQPPSSEGPRKGFSAPEVPLPDSQVSVEEARRLAEQISGPEYEQVNALARLASSSLARALIQLTAELRVAREVEQRAQRLEDALRALWYEFPNALKMSKEHEYVELRKFVLTALQDTLGDGE